ncbi:MAG: hypothetical protein SGI91_00315 [Alphaproteobacteria bacterium]|nr:hypothetical protein [Alphaproteobacteria bacterium]
MRRILLATAALAFSAGMAMAADDADIEITAEQEMLCEITQVSGSIPLAGVNVGVQGVFNYTCNFEGSPHFIFTSTNGGVYTSENGTATADYGIFLNDQTPAVSGFPTPSTWLKASDSTTGAEFDGISLSSPPNDEMVTEFWVGLVEALPVAGSYSDTLSINITP